MLINYPVIQLAPYLNDHEVFDNRIVRRGTSKPWPASALYGSLSLSPAQQRRLDRFRTKGFLLAQNGALLLEHYQKTYKVDSLSNSFAMANGIVSLLIGIALGEGKIKSLDDRAAHYIPHLAYRRRITIRDLLTMSSGLKWKESFRSPLSALSRAYYSKDLKGLVFSLRAAEPPGIEFNYCSGNIQLLAMVLKNATGIHLSEYASVKLWQPMGAESDGHWSLDSENGMEKAFSCFNATLRDFARIGQLILQKGRWEDRQLVPEAYIREALQPAGYLKETTGKTVDFYGFHFWLTNYQGYEIIYLNGVKGQFIFIIPSLNAVVVRLGEQGSAVRSGILPKDALLYLEMAFQLLNG